MGKWPSIRPDEWPKGFCKKLGLIIMKIETIRLVTAITSYWGWSLYQLDGCYLIFLGIEFVSTKKGIFIHQKNYEIDILKKFNITNCNLVTTLVEIGLKLERGGRSLRYLCNTRPDLAYSVGMVSIFMEKPQTPHFFATKRILRHVKRTLDFGILTWNDKCTKANMNSITRYVFMFGKTPISWCSNKKSVVVLSSCGAKYISTSMVACQTLWMEILLQKLNFGDSKPMTLLIDNKSTIDLTKHPIAYGRSKHIETRFHFLRDQVTKGRLELDYFQLEEDSTTS
ncbi:hypothetical protein CR513_25197, partial [Mucuna pruriens]